MKTLAYFLLILFGFINPIFSQNLEGINSGLKPQVVAIFPSSDTLPENLLRMYIHFSKPMKPVGNLEKIQLKDENGHEVVGAIFNNVYELWNHEQTQLTLLLDPSRVKTGLKSHKERGRALLNGKRYQLVIGELQDVDGRATTPFTKSITVVEEDMTAPNTDSWVFKMPKIGSRNPLIIKFPEMLDKLSMIQRLKVADGKNQAVAGKVEIISKETEWHFFPDKSWVAGNYILYVHSRLEDPSGNNLNGLFDHKPETLKNDHEGNIETITFKLTK